MYEYSAGAGPQYSHSQPIKTASHVAGIMVLLTNRQSVDVGDGKRSNHS